MTFTTEVSQDGKEERGETVKVAYLKDYLADRPLDLKYMGQKLPGDPQKRQKLLEGLKDMLPDL